MPDRSRPSEGSWTAEALATGRLQRLRPSMPAAGDLVNRARMHLRSAGLIADNDPTLAMSACHDAARQGISAHMRATGYRATAEAGAHRLVIEYASVVLAGVISEDDVVALDELRRDRHTAEYGDFASRTITAERVRDALALAGRIVDAVANELARKDSKRSL